MAPVEKFGIVPTPELAATIRGLRRLWREGIESGESAPLDAEDIKRRGRARLAVLKKAEHRGALKRR